MATDPAVKQAADLFLEAARSGKPLVDSLVEAIAKANQELIRQRDGYQKECHLIEQHLGKALHYPELYPLASREDDGQVCIGEHVPETLAMEAARRIQELELRLEQLGQPVPKTEGGCQLGSLVEGYRVAKTFLAWLDRQRKIKYVPWVLNPKDGQYEPKKAGEQECRDRMVAELDLLIQEAKEKEL